MAGGLGTKLWPISTETEPKQFLKIVGEKTLYQMNVEGLLERYSPEDIFVSITPDYVHFIEEQTPQIPRENYIVEPMFRGTGPASCFAMLKVAEQYPDEVIMFYVQPVVVRDPNEKYLDMIDGMNRLVEETDQLITGIKFPEYIETGSDLIELGEEIDRSDELKYFKVESWVDVVNKRMSYEQVEKLVSTNRYALHCNHYMWKPNPFFKAVKEYRSDWYEILMDMKSKLGKENEQEIITKLYAQFSTDRMEVITQPLFNAKKAMVVLLPFEWTHITTWVDVEEYYKAHNVNSSMADTVEIDSENNFVFTKNKKLVTLIGMKDFVVIDSGKALLIAPKKEISKVKDLNDKVNQCYKEYV